MFIRPANLIMLQECAKVGELSLEELMSLAMECGCEVMRSRMGYDDGEESSFLGVDWAGIGRLS